MVLLLLLLLLVLFLLPEPRAPPTRVLWSELPQAPDLLTEGEPRAEHRPTPWAQSGGDWPAHAAGSARLARKAVAPRLT